MQPFHIDVAGGVLDDLRARLARFRAPDQIVDSGWSYGTDTAYLQELIRHWAVEFDWTAAQQELNTYSQFVSKVCGSQLHFVQIRSSRHDAIPIVLLHGWPASFVQMLQLGTRLAHPGTGELAFHVVIPSLPGFGFSEIPREPGMSVRRIAPLIHGLMTQKLGHDRYGMRSSDLGAGVANAMALAYPDAVIGSHTGGTNPWLQGELPSDLTPEEREFVAAAQAWSAGEMAYAQLHATKPQTLANALNDSPAGLASWIIEKFHRWSDHDGRIEEAIDRDSLLINLTLYWVTRTIGSSMRLYYETVRDPGGWGTPAVPLGYLMPRKDMFPTPRSWIARQGPIAHWTEVDRGGHFIEWEEPDLVADDIRVFFAGIAGPRARAS